MNTADCLRNRPLRRGRELPIAASLCFALALACAQAVAALPAAVDGERLPTLADVVERVEHGVVNISGRRSNDIFQDTQDWEDFENLFRYFNIPELRRRPPREQPHGRALGSGVIIDAERGYIITNAHVLVNKNIIVTLSDGRTIRPEVLGKDTEMDLALLQVDADRLTEVPVGDSDELRVGDFVLALGSPFGLRATVTSGIVSALGRHGLGMDKYENFIQTDAAINPGNSGGPLVNLAGELVGINTAIYAPGGGNVGIGFAIPINAAYSVVRQIAEHGKVERGLLGVRFQELTPALANALGVVSAKGVVISSVVEGSAASEVGLVQGDVLTHVNGIEIADGAHLRSVIALIRAGDAARVRYLRDGDSHDGQGTILPRGFHNVSGGEFHRRFAGAEFRNHAGEVSGIRVEVIDPYSPAWNLGLREKDVIVEVNRKRVESVSELEAVLQDQSRRLALSVLRDGHVIAMTSSR